MERGPKASLFLRRVENGGILYLDFGAGRGEKEVVLRLQEAVPWKRVKRGGYQNL